MVTKKGLALKFANAWHTLDISSLENVLTEDVIYSSEWVTGLINGKNDVLNYLGEKFLAIRNNNQPVTPELGLHYNEPCVILNQKLLVPEPSYRYTVKKDNEGSETLEQKMTDKIELVVLFEYKSDKISKINVCAMTTVEDVQRSPFTSPIWDNDFA